MIDRAPSTWIATWLGAGLLPWAPGTWGSLAALPFAWAIQAAGGQVALLAASLVVFAVGCWAAAAYCRRSGVKDPGAVVIDEVAGQWLTLAFVPLSAWGFVLGFILFRAADIGKPWPASWIDREVKGGLGVMGDDMVAGLYAGLALWLVWMME